MLPEVMLAVIVILASTNTISFLYSWEERRQKLDARRQRDQAVDVADKALVAQNQSETRQAEVAKIHQELLSRPVQAVIPTGAIEAMAQAVIQYLQATEKK